MNKFKSLNYIVESDEQTSESASIYETKALLFLLDREQLDGYYANYFIIDVFNDVTAVFESCNNTSEMIDVQSKGDSKTTSPKAIGKKSVTLYQNYVKKLPINKYFLFLNSVSNKNLENSDKKIFSIDNIKKDMHDKLKEGLKKEAQNKSYISNNLINDENINKFLKELVIIKDNNSDNWVFVKNVINNDEVAKIISEEDMNKIFDDIRDLQNNVKHKGKIHGSVINSLEDEILKNRIIKTEDIKKLILQRIVNFEIIENKGGIYLHDFVLDSKEQKKCQSKIYGALCDSTFSVFFWCLFINVYQIIKNNKNDNVNEIFNKIDKDVLNDVEIYLDKLSIKYFIACTKEGFYED